MFAQVLQEKEMGKLLILAILVFATVCSVAQLRETRDVIVKLSQGSLQGQKVTSDKTGVQYYSFKGIPYAQPPVGDLRFKAPTEAPTWNGIRNATFHRSICLQLTVVTVAADSSEDCLYLNVYTPQLPNTSAQSLLPVMVWIYGGAFTSGTGDYSAYKPDYLVDKGVLLVTFNYRLGVLGFLGLNNSLVSSNNGLKDQRAALRWVQANIVVFGGDKEKVTIFGESAGAGSVELQIISPSTKGLFQRAISQSGNALDSWAYVDPSLARRRAFLLGEILGLTSDSEDDLITLLKNATAEELVTSQGKVVTYDHVLKGVSIAFQPTQESGEDVFLTDNPLNIMKSGSYEHVPYITGFNSAEGKIFVHDYLNNDSLWTALSNNMEQFVPSQLGLPLGSTQSLSIADEIRKMYFGNDTLSVKNIEGLVNCFSDLFFVTGVRRSSSFRLKTSSAPVYVYQFSYVGRLSMSEYMFTGYSFRGASHGDDLGYLFNHFDVRLESNTTEMAVLHAMTTMWTNFAKTGNPSEGLDIQWNAMTSSNKSYLNIDTELSIRNLDELHVKRFAMWDKIFSANDN